MIFWQSLFLFIKFSRWTIINIQMNFVCWTISYLRYVKLSCNKYLSEVYRKLSIVRLPHALQKKIRIVMRTRPLDLQVPGH